MEIADEDLHGFKTAYLVRLKADQQFPHEFVGIFLADDVPELIDLLDDCCPVDACEYAILPSGGIFQPGRSGIVPVPEDDETDLFRAAVISENWTGSFYDTPDGKWTELGQDTAND